MPSVNPNASEKRWLISVVELSSILTGGPAVIHHAVGRTARHNKVDIGHKWIIPLTPDEHRALHVGATFGYYRRKDFEKAKFGEILILLPNHPDYPPPDVITAIMEYHL